MFTNFKYYNNLIIVNTKITVVTNLLKHRSTKIIRHFTLMQYLIKNLRSRV